MSQLLQRNLLYYHGQLWRSYMEFDCTEEAETVTLPPNQYLFMCDGAPGGAPSNQQCTVGARVYGILTVEEDTPIYVHVGGHGEAPSDGNAIGGYNGGGAGNGTGYSGGGATDVRLKEDDMYHRLIVASGGGGYSSNASADQFEYAGDGGGLYGGYPHLSNGFQSLVSNPELSEYYGISQNIKDFRLQFPCDSWSLRMPNYLIPLKYALTNTSLTSTNGEGYFNIGNHPIDGNTRIVLRVKMHVFRYTAVGSRTTLMTSQYNTDQIGINTGTSREKSGFTICVVRETATKGYFQLHEAQETDWIVRRNEINIDSSIINAYGTLVEIECTFSPNPTLKVTPITYDENNQEIRGTTMIGTQSSTVENPYVKHASRHFTITHNDIYLFKNGEGGTKYTSNCAFYDLKIYQDHYHLTNHYVPAHNLQLDYGTTRACIYDVKNQRLFPANTDRVCKMFTTSNSIECMDVKRTDYFEDTDDVYSLEECIKTFHPTNIEANDGHTYEMSFDLVSLTPTTVNHFTFSEYKDSENSYTTTNNNSPLLNLLQPPPFINGIVNQHIVFQNTIHIPEHADYETNEFTQASSDRLDEYNENRIKWGMDPLWLTQEQRQSVFATWLEDAIQTQMQNDFLGLNSFYLSIDDTYLDLIDNGGESGNIKNEILNLYGKHDAVRLSREDIESLGKVVVYDDGYNPEEPPQPQYPTEIITGPDAPPMSSEEASECKCIYTSYFAYGDTTSKLGENLNVYTTFQIFLSDDKPTPTTEIEIKCSIGSIISDLNASTYPYITLLSVGNTDKFGKSGDPKLPQFHIYLAYNGTRGIGFVRTHQTANGDSSITSDTINTSRILQLKNATNALNLNSNDIIIMRTDGEYLRLYAIDGELIASVQNMMVPPSSDLPFSDFSQLEDSYYHTFSYYNDASCFLKTTNSSSITQFCGNLTFYDIKHYQNQVLHRHYIPIRKPYVLYTYDEERNIENQSISFKAEFVDLLEKTRNIHMPTLDDVRNCLGVTVTKYFNPNWSFYFHTAILSADNVLQDEIDKLKDEGYMKTILVKNMQFREVTPDTEATYHPYRGIIYPSQEQGYSFGQGMPAIITNAAGAGGGWFGGYSGTDNGGSGSSYAYTASSYKPSGYMSEPNYYLTDVLMTMGGSDYHENANQNDLTQYAKCVIYVPTESLYPNDKIQFFATGRPEKITLPAGKYKLTCIGGDGGYRYRHSSIEVSGTTSEFYQLGGYASGFLEVDDTRDLYVNVGGSGMGSMLTDDVLAMHMHNFSEAAKQEYVTSNKPLLSYNGGGSVDYPGSNGTQLGYGIVTGGWGGGATDIRLDENDLNHRVLVAGGGGGMGSTNRPGTCGGGISGQNSKDTNYAGQNGGYGKYNGSSAYTSNSSIHNNVINGQFGIGGNGFEYKGGVAGAGGGGWYGGSGTFQNVTYDTNAREGYGGSGWAWGATSNGKSQKPSSYAFTTEATYLTGTDHNGNTVLPYMPDVRTTVYDRYGFAKATIEVDDISYLYILCKDAEGVKYYHAENHRWEYLSDNLQGEEQFKTYGVANFLTDEGLLDEFDVVSFDETGYTRCMVMSASPKTVTIVAYTDSNIGVQEVLVDYDAEENYDLSYHIEKTGNTAHDPLRVEVTITKLTHVPNSVLKLYFLQLNGKTLFDEKFFQEGKYNYFSNRNGVQYVETPKPPLGEENEFYDKSGHVKTYQSLLSVQNGDDLNVKFVTYMDAEYGLLRPVIGNTVICEYNRCLYIGTVIYVPDQQSGLDYRFYVRKYALLSGEAETIFDLPIQKFRQACNNNNIVTFNGMAVNDDAVFLLDAGSNDSYSNKLFIISRDNTENVSISAQFPNTNYYFAGFGKIVWYDRETLMMMGYGTSVKPAILLYHIPSNSWGVNIIPNIETGFKIVDYSVGSTTILLTHEYINSEIGCQRIIAIDRTIFDQYAVRNAYITLPSEVVSTFYLPNSPYKASNGMSFICYTSKTDIPNYQSIHSEPADWNTSYRQYYQFNETHYESLDNLDSVPTFISDTFYTKESIDGGVFFIVQKDKDRSGYGQMYVYDELQKSFICNFTGLLFNNPTNVTYVEDNTLVIQNEGRSQYIYQIYDFQHPEMNLTYRYSPPFYIPKKNLNQSIPSDYNYISNQTGVNTPISVHGYYFTAMSTLAVVNNIGNAKYNTGFKFKRQIIDYNRANSTNLEYDQRFVTEEGSCLIIGNGQIQYDFQPYAEHIYATHISKSEYDYFSSAKFVSIVEDTPYEMKVDVRGLVYVNGCWDENNDVIYFPEATKETLISELFDKHSAYYDATSISGLFESSGHVLLYYQIGFYRENGTFISKSNLIRGRNQYVDIPSACSKLRILLTYDIENKELLNTDLRTCQLIYRKTVS